MARKALLVVDVQNDFCEGGSLAVAGGAATAARIDAFLREHSDDYALVVASRDWHEAPPETNGGHFALDGAPDFVGTWPVHCVAGTPGAAFHPALDPSRFDAEIRKGQGRPAYSLFEGVTEGGTDALTLLREHEIDAVDVCGIATDYCVLQTALGALERGFPTTVLRDLVAGVDPATSARALDEIEVAGGTSKDALPTTEEATP